MTAHNYNAHASPEGNATGRRKPLGQALTEYALILALVVIGLIVILALVGPAIGNLFSNTIYVLLEAEEPRETLSPEEFWATITQVWLITPGVTPFQTWTPAPATFTPTIPPSPTPSPTVPSPTPTLSPTPGPSPTPEDQVFTLPWDDNIEGGLASRDNFIAPEGANNCYWDITTERFHSAAHAWSDSPGAYYIDGSDCSLELRGTIDLTTATAPELTFWDSWHLVQYDRVFVEVLPEGESTWTNLTFADSGALHYNSTNLNFTFEQVDLADYVGQQIRLRFRLDATANAAVGDGWYIDDIALQEANYTVFTLPFLDDVEGTPQCPADGSCWIPGGTWAISGEEVHSPGHAWSDSPGANYDHGTNSSLTLNGEIDLSAAIRPEMRFWDRWHLRPYDHAYVEIATESDNWVIVLDHYNTANLSWTRQTIDLSGYIGERIRLRFRLDATNHSATGNGWWVDDIEVTEAATPIITLPWLDDMESGNRWWVPEGTWALSSEQFHSGEAAWSDSVGRDYEHGSNASLILDAIVDLQGTSHPELVFWDRFNLRAYDRGYVEVSQDNGVTWIPIFQHYNSTNLSWTRQIVDLSLYAGLPNVRLRFRLDARSHTQVGDGWWIDDVELREHVSAVITLPWCDDFEADATDWCNDMRDFSQFWAPGGHWTLASEGPSAAGGVCHSGSTCWTDSPASNYDHLSNATLELDAQIDLAGTTNPILYFWHAYNLRYNDGRIVEVSTDGGTTWVDADPAHGTDRAFYTTNLAWTRNQVSLASWAGQRIMIRFRLEALDSAQTGDGWWIDDVSIVDYTPRVYELPFLDEAEPGFWPNWIVEGTWSLNNTGIGGGAPGTCDNPLCRPSDWTYDDSPAASYAHNTSFAMTLDGVIDLTGTTHPALTVWAVFIMGVGDHAQVQVSVDGGYVWLDPPAPPNIAGLDLYGGSDTTWHQHVGDLTNYVSYGDISLRLLLEARQDYRVGPGVNFDRIEIAD